MDSADHISDLDLLLCGADATRSSRDCGCGVGGGSLRSGGAAALVTHSTKPESRERRNEMRNFDGQILKTSALLLILWVTHKGMSGAQANQGSGGTLRVVCSLEQPVVEPHGQVTAGVLVDAPKGSAVRYLWKATTGGFVAKPGSPAALSKEGDEATVQWDPNGAAPGAYTLSVQVTDAQGASGSCAVAVQVSEEQEHRDASGGGELGSEAARALLVKGRTERKGYGLYSYILARRPLNAGSNDRLKEVLKAYLKLEDVNLEKAFKLSELNITYVPVTRSSQNPLAVEWVLANYDYAAASFLLSSLPKQEAQGDGPFIVSSIQPLRGPETHADFYIMQDLSTVPVSIIPLWMNQFRSQTTQQRVWEKKTIGNMALELRTAIAIAAEGLPMVQKALGALIVTAKQ